MFDKHIEQDIDISNQLTQPHQTYSELFNDSVMTDKITNLHTLLTNLSQLTVMKGQQNHIEKMINRLKQQIKSQHQLSNVGVNLSTYQILKGPWIVTMLSYHVKLQPLPVLQHQSRKLSNKPSLNQILGQLLNDNKGHQKRNKLNF